MNLLVSCTLNKATNKQKNREIIDHSHLEANAILLLSMYNLHDIYLEELSFITIVHCDLAIATHGKKMHR